MGIQKKNLKIMVRLWSLTTLAVTLLSLPGTSAVVIESVTGAVSATIQPASESSTRANDLKLLRLTTTQPTLQQDNLLTTTKQLPSEEETTYTSTASASITLAFSNTPATATNQAKVSTINKHVPVDGEQQGETTKDRITKATATNTKWYKDNDELETEIKETDLKQVTETILEQQRQQHQQQPKQITEEVSWHKETDMHRQSTENASDIQKAIKIAATMVAQVHASISPSVTESTSYNAITTNTAITDAPNGENDNQALTPALHAEPDKPDHIKQKEIAGDDVKLKEDEMKSMTLTLERDRQAVEDFKPIIKDANAKLLQERTIFASRSDANNEEWKQNLMPNELQYEQNKPLLARKFEHNINWSPYLHSAAPVTDFTGKLLQEQDGVITEIEQKFGLNKFVDGNELKSPTNIDSATYTTPAEPTGATNSATSHSVNHKISDLNKSPILNRSPVEFIERRVKKSFDFPMHRVASDAQHLEQHFDFANTKFNSNNNEQHTTQDAKINNDGQQKENPQPPRPQPEFSTTKFYNSKELYNEMLHHKLKLQQQLPHAANGHDKDIEELNNRAPSLALNSFAVLHSPKVAKLEEMHEAKISQHQQKQHQEHKSLTIKKVTVKATKQKDAIFSAEKSATATTTTSTSAASIETTPNIKAEPTKSLGSNTLTEMPLDALVKTKKFQKELKRAKLLIKSMMPLQTTTGPARTAGSSNHNYNSNNDLKSFKQKSATTISPLQIQTQTESKINCRIAASLQVATTPTTLNSSQSSPPSSSMSTIATSAATASEALLQTLTATSTNTPKTPSHPIVRPRILSRLQEKINSLECELQNLPQDSHLWRGNETHELLLPIMTPENCKNDKDCTAMMVSWEGEAEIQSGDILIVEINDALLTPKDINLTTTSAHNTQVYQVTRSGHEHCDVTEGILLDITPLIVDGRKLVTLYDKDLTEGVNLLIVVSELWGSQCVRLKVTTKTENCGESADCSGKGICFSNYDMEEYECQCCSGFAGPHCEEIDACTPSPCTNNGICVDLSQGHEGNAYQCLCPYGYTGKNCQYELDPCNAAECLNGGSCVGNSTHFRCECTPSYTGPLCQHSLNECESSPCIHGICVDQEDGFRCFCQPGFAGELCNFEYNECESNPCQNGGECIDHIGSYECHCSKGYTGNRCHIKVDFCANKPCPEGRRCIDHGNEYSCECLGGRNGPDCNEMQRTQCNVNPCTHGGTCWSSGDSFYCACRPGYTGTMCEDEFVVETVVSSSEFIVDDTSARNFNDKSFGSSVVLKSPIELHNAYTAAIVLALVIFFVALYLTICHCKVNQTYRKFSTRTYGFLSILGFRLRTKQATSKISRHWLSGKGLGIGNAMRSSVGAGLGLGSGAMTSSSSTSALHATAASSSQRNSVGHLPTAKASTGKQQQHTHVGQLNERPFQRHLAMNLENDMYYTVDFSENSQHSPLIQ